MRCAAGWNADAERSPRPLVTLEPREAYALLIVLRSPAVAALLEAQNALRMTESEIGFQKDQAEEAARVMNRDQALEWLQKDDWVRGQMIGVCIDHIKRMIEKEPAAEAR